MWIKIIVFQLDINLFVELICMGFLFLGIVGLTYFIPFICVKCNLGPLNIQSPFLNA